MGYISGQKLERERSKSFAVSISMQTKTITSLENILQTPGNRAEVDQNHDARNLVSATVSVLNLSMAIFRPTTSKVSAQKALLCPFHCKTRPSAPSLASKGLKNIPEVPGNPPEVCQNYDARKAVPATFSVLK